MSVGVPDDLSMVGVRYESLSEYPAIAKQLDQMIYRYPISVLEAFSQRKQ